ncbi:hypothetical protein [Prevotella sp. 10(H)]|uniref:hypothetical protein n=1 Tax=Prevotella sp. 10(H) TaxID=1158294 RepID=UPI0012DE3929|nr:hypothetical protein [Prevotella sp. 10(H)]
MNQEKNKTFRVVYLEATPDGVNSISKKPDAPDGYQCCYFNKDSKLLKRYFRRYSYPDSQSYIVADYDDSGHLASIQFNIQEPEGYSVYGKINIQEGDTNQLINNYVIQSMDDDTIEEIKETSDTFPLQIGNWMLSNFLSVDSLLQYLGTDKIIIPSDAAKVRLKNPKAGDVAFTNTNDVEVMAGRSGSSEVITTIQIGTYVKIKKVIKGPAGSNWCKIKFLDGYLEKYNDRDMYLDLSSLNCVETLTK